VVEGPVWWELMVVVGVGVEVEVEVVCGGRVGEERWWLKGLWMTGGGSRES